nr:MAG TPA: hypothetical protein [Caudoviricetes sp.]
MYSGTTVRRNLHLMCATSLSRCQKLIFSFVITSALESCLRKLLK